MRKEWLQENCNPDDPTENMVWAIMCFLWNGLPFPMGVPMAKALSEHLNKCGFVHDPSKQTIKYRRPFRGQQTQYNGAGSWVDIDEPDPAPVVIQDFSKATPEERAAAAAQLRALGETV